MSFKKLALALTGAALLAAPAVSSAVAAENEQFIPSLVYRTGPYSPNGTPVANGFADYFNMLNARDGGINGVKLVVEECETGYNTAKGVECYERLKGKGPTGATAFNPMSTGITYALIEKATADKIPIISMGYGRTAAGDGRVFPYVFPLVTTYWDDATAIIKYIAGQEGGYDKLKGKKIALVFHNSAYGKEPIPILKKMAAKYGYKFSEFPVQHPGLEQKATWLQIGRRLKPDWVILWGWGVMNSTAIKEAAAVRFPRDRMVGVWWSGAEQDVLPAGKGATGYTASTFHGAGADYSFLKDIKKYVYDAGNGKGKKENVGQVLYNRGALNAMLEAEAIRTAQEKFGKRPLTGEEVQWGIEHLNLTAERIKQIGFEGFIAPLQISCKDHVGGGKIRIQKWDGKKWVWASEWLESDRSMVRPMIEEAAAQYAKEKGITPRDCK